MKPRWACWQNIIMVRQLKELKKKPVKEGEGKNWSRQWFSHFVVSDCEPVDCSTLGFPLLHCLLKFAQTHVHWVGDAIQSSHPLLPASPALNLSQHQGLFQWVGSSPQVSKGLELQLQHQCFFFFPYTLSYHRLKQNNTTCCRFTQKRCFHSAFSWRLSGSSATASVLPMNIQDWFPLGFTGLILLSKGLWRIFSSTTVWKHQFCGAQPSLWSNSHIRTWLLEKHSFH